MLQVCQAISQAAKSRRNQVTCVEGKREGKSSGVSGSCQCVPDAQRHLPAGSAEANAQGEAMRAEVKAHSKGLGERPPKCGSGCLPAPGPYTRRLATFRVRLAGCRLALRPFWLRRQRQCRSHILERGRVRCDCPRAALLSTESGRKPDVRNPAARGLG